VVFLGMKFSEEDGKLWFRGHGYVEWLCILSSTITADDAVKNSLNMFISLHGIQ
jgi:hypothetical protein